MAKNPVPVALDHRETLLRQFERLAIQVETAVPELGIERLASNANRDMLLAFHNTAEDLGRNLARYSAPSPPQEDIRLLGAEFRKQFRLPALSETSELLQSLASNMTARVTEHNRARIDDLRHAMDAMTAPWLNMRFEFRSLTGFAGLQDLGKTLRAAATFDAEPARHLRVLLGDWRREIEWPTEIFTDPFARSHFYFDRGLDPALTEFPADAFREVLAIGGIRPPLPPLIDDYDCPPTDEHDKEERGLERNNTAHDRLQRFETHVRRFIDQRMTASFGANWTKHHVPGPVRQQWCTKQEKSREEGEPERPLIAYADFTDYEPIIVREDNWKRVFEPIFRRKTLVQESLRRLYPIRVCTMHARFITQDDELYLFAETQRLLQAMEIEM